jgi:hypothetical protein
MNTRGRVHQSDSHTYRHLKRVQGVRFIGKGDGKLVVTRVDRTCLRGRPLNQGVSATPEVRSQSLTQSLRIVRSYRIIQDLMVICRLQATRKKNQPQPCQGTINRRYQLSCWSTLSTYAVRTDDFECSRLQSPIDNARAGSTP